MMKALQTLSYRYLVITLSLLLSLSTVAQNNSNVYRQLVKRYGNVTRWGKGYILRVNSFYGFANAQRRILIPINNTRFDTLFPDRASVCGPAGGLVDEYGNFIVRMGFCVDRVVNRQHRLMAATAREGNEVLCNDKGQWITKEYDATLPKETLIASMAPG